MYRVNPKSKIRQYLEEQLTKHGEAYIKKLEVQVESVVKNASTLEKLAQSGIPIEKQSLELFLKEVKDIKKDFKPSKDNIQRKRVDDDNKIRCVAGLVAGALLFGTIAYINLRRQSRGRLESHKQDTYESQPCESSNDYELTNDSVQEPNGDPLSDISCPQDTEYRSGSCVYPDLGGETCEFDGDCDGENCILGRCTRGK